eukprot:9063864-Lingulodinium_polyedra.AAC.1
MAQLGAPGLSWCRRSHDGCARRVRCKGRSCKRPGGRHACIMRAHGEECDKCIAGFVAQLK